MKKPSVDGQVIVVTGASSGIGRVSARELAARGAEVVLVCRDAQRGESARQEVAAAATGRPPVLLVADLSSQASIRALADEINKRYPHIDVLLNNAGAMYTRRQITVDGIEETLATNHLAPFLLTHLVRDRLAAAPAARVVTVASRIHVRGAIDFDDLQGQRRYSAMGAYAQAKLGNILFTYELARRLAGTRVTANCLHPGVIASGFGRNTPGLFAVGVRIASLFMKSPETGAATSIHVASSPDVAGLTGTYFVDSRPARSSRASQDAAVAARLWSVSAELTGIPAA
jgi:NAD(P)-dependent dehydrogenase (short-subunit alcohol dehydrogenase family)